MKRRRSKELQGAVTVERVERGEGVRSLLVESPILPHSFSSLSFF